MTSKQKKIIICWTLIAISIAIRVAFLKFESGDYTGFLSIWVDSYRNQSIGDAMRSDISDYPPVYNYFLILFSRININELYLIKALSTLLLNIIHLCI